MSVEQGPWKQQPQRRPVDEFKPFSPAQWAETAVPTYDWIVDGVFMRGSVGILSGDGGLGKSLICQQLLTAAALGVPWLGFATKKARGLAIFSEDDGPELHRRQSRINRHYDCSYDDLHDVRMESRAGRDSVLMQFGRWGDDGSKTTLFEQLRTAARAHKAEIIILDNLADVFAGNEIDRNQPRTFIRELRRLAIETQGVVILTQHPSLEGMRGGTGMSGSTGWNNSVRSRLYLTSPRKKADEDDDAKANERVLKVMKNNSAAKGGKVPLVWRDGVFARVEEPAQRQFWQEKQEGDGWPE